MADNLLICLNLSLEFTPSFQSPERRNKFIGVIVWVCCFLKMYQFKPGPSVLIQNRNLIFCAQNTWNLPLYWSDFCKVRWTATALAIAEYVTGWREPGFAFPFHLLLLEESPSMDSSRQLLSFTSPKPFRVPFRQRSVSPVTTALKRTFNWSKSKCSHSNCKTF